MVEQERLNHKRLTAFRLLEEVWESFREGSQTKPGSLGTALERALMDNLNVSPDEVFDLTTRFVVAKISGEGAGGVTQLPEFDDLPEDLWIRTRLASWAWFYTGRRVSPLSLRPGKSKEDLLARTRFEFGNSDGESEQLLKWADENPHKIADFFERAIKEGLLSIFHQKLLDEFRVKLEQGSLRLIDS